MQRAGRTANKKTAGTRRTAARPGKNTITIDGHPESVAADAEGNIYFTCIGSRLTPTEKDKDGYLGVIPHGSTEPKKSRT